MKNIAISIVCSTSATLGLMSDHWGNNEDAGMFGIVAALTLMWLIVR